MAENKEFGEKERAEFWEAYRNLRDSFEDIAKVVSVREGFPIGPWNRFKNYLPEFVETFAKYAASEGVSKDELGSMSTGLEPRRIPDIPGDELSPMI